MNEEEAFRNGPGRKSVKDLIEQLRSGCDLSDQHLLAELARRVEADTGIRHKLEDVLYDCGLSLEDIEPSVPQRLWVLGPGEWLSPNFLNDKSAPLMFRACDEFGNRTLSLRLLGHRLLVLNLAWPMAYDLQLGDEPGSTET